MSLCLWVYECLWVELCAIVLLTSQLAIEIQVVIMSSEIIVCVARCNVLCVIMITCAWYWTFGLLLGQIKFNSLRFAIQRLVRCSKSGQRMPALFVASLFLFVDRVECSVITVNLILLTDSFMSAMACYWISMRKVQLSLPSTSQNVDSTWYQSFLFRWRKSIDN